MTGENEMKSTITAVDDPIWGQGYIISGPRLATEFCVTMERAEARLAEIVATERRIALTDAELAAEDKRQGYMTRQDLRNEENGIYGSDTEGILGHGTAG